MTELEYGSDDYLLKKWESLLPDLVDEADGLLIAKMLENQANFDKSPLQILGEEALPDNDESQKGVS